MSKRVKVDLPPKEQMTYGIDVSHHQGYRTLEKQEWRNAKFVICRTGDGKDADSMFSAHWEHAKMQGKICGSYHYFRADRGNKNVEVMLKQLDAVNYDPAKDLPPAIDLEAGAWLNVPGGLYPGDSDLTDYKVMQQLLGFKSALKVRFGRYPILYTGQAFHWRFSQNPAFFVECLETRQMPLWVPSYGSTCRVPADQQGNPFPWYKPIIWQFNGTGIDENYFVGSEQDLKDFISPPEPKKPTLEERVTDLEAVVAELTKCDG